MKTIDFKNLLTPAPSNIGRDVHKQLLSLRNIKALELILQSNKEENLNWLGKAIDLLKTCDAAERDHVLNKPYVYLWIEKYKNFTSMGETEKQTWIWKGFVHIFLQLNKRVNPVLESLRLRFTVKPKDIFFLKDMTENQAAKEILVISENNDITFEVEHVLYSFDVHTFHKAFTLPFITNEVFWFEEYVNIASSAELRMNMEITEVVSEDINNSFEEALQLIKISWPEMFAEIDGNIENIVFFNPPGLPFFSDFRVHGTIFACHVARPVVKIAEWLIHEASHNRLNTIMCARPHIFNDMKPIYTSPWRDELRPLYGIYHGCFVHCRVLHFYRLLKKKRATYKGVSMESEIERISEELQLGLSTIEEHASLSPDGEALVHDMQNLVIADSK
ncbi:HEXXH motif-containing putative peptide modification protein [Peribacillus sp. FSL E2-0218]|uniref:aKG-HExxH-type peptide beta-hydroxylase n=1 Tax=Peribacillus sp. FSL E2-0218 TaxID=2921364 RepID=UPI0030EB64AA